jgi:hypothetical protein
VLRPERQRNRHAAREQHQRRKKAQREDHVGKKQRDDAEDEAEGQGEEQRREQARDQPERLPAEHQRKRLALPRPNRQHHAKGGAQHAERDERRPEARQRHQQPRKIGAAHDALRPSQRARDEAQPAVEQHERDVAGEEIDRVRDAGIERLGAAEDDDQRHRRHERPEDEHPDAEQRAARLAQRQLLEQKPEERAVAPQRLHVRQSGVGLRLDDDGRLEGSNAVVGHAALHPNNCRSPAGLCRHGSPTSCAPHSCASGARSGVTNRDG